MNNNTSSHEVKHLLRLAERSIDQSPQKSAYYFKTGVGEYAEHEKFLGLSVPVLQKIAKKVPHISNQTITTLLQSPYNEIRYLALIFLKREYSQATKAQQHTQQQKLIDFYLDHKKHINNWNLVDNSSPQILGHWLYHHPNNTLLWALIKEKQQWPRRIAVVSQLPAIKLGHTKTAYALIEYCLKDTEDLMHKACGWMLRECGKIDNLEQEQFIKKHLHQMPRVMLRYGIEHMDEKKRKALLMKKF